MDSPLADPRWPIWSRGVQFLRDYAWVIGKNILGWLLIGASLVLGPTVPGPGGIPLFLIGFALVTFPGKRRLTSRVLRGRRIGRPHPVYNLVALGLSIVLPLVLTLIFATDGHVRAWLKGAVADPDRVMLCADLAMMALCWTVLRLVPGAINLLLPLVPRVRRKIRPWMRQHGIHLLPPRHRHRVGPPHTAHKPYDEIIEFTERFGEQFVALWHGLRRSGLLIVMGLVLMALAGWLWYRH